MRFKSITTPGVYHTIPNLLTEFIFLNKDIRIGQYPWRGESGRSWSKTLACIKKLMKEPFGLDAEQIAFYIYKCNPQAIKGKEFGKMAVVAKKLFKKYNISDLHRIYEERRTICGSVPDINHKKSHSKTLLELLKELENEQK